MLQDGGEDEVGAVGSPHDAAPSPAPNFTQTRPREPPRCERAVASRTRFLVTLPSAASSKEPTTRTDEQHGWSSPHGEPYRPLGRPQLHLKLSPRLPGGLQLNTQRSRGLEASAAGYDSAAGPDKDKELRQPTTCSAAAGGATSSAAAAAAAAVHSLFPLAPGGHKRSMDERQAKLARRLHASVGSYSPERVRGLHRRKPPSPPSEGVAGEKQRGDRSLGLLRQAIHECAGRLRAARNGSSFLQQLPAAEHRELQALREQYLQARLQPPAATTAGARTSTRVLLDGREPSMAALEDGVAVRARRQLEQDQTEQEQWYLPYTTRELQRSPHQRLPSVRELRLRVKDDKLPLRPLRSSIALASPAKRASVSRSSVMPLAAVSGIHPVGQHSDSDSDATTASAALLRVAATTSPCASPAEVETLPAHSVEKLQAAVDSLEAAKSEQSERLATALDVLRQDRRECLAGKFRSLCVRGDAEDDLRRMRVRSERRRGQRVQAALAKTTLWYPELLRKLLARESCGSGPGGPATLLAAELFLLQAVRRFSNAGREVESTLLFQLVLCLHPDDLLLPSVQQLLGCLRDALHVERQDWDDFFEAHELPQPLDELSDERKDVGSALGECRSVSSSAVASTGASPLGSQVHAVVTIRRELRRMK